MYYGEKSYLLQTQDLRAGQANESCIRVNTKDILKLIVYTLQLQSILNNHVFSLRLTYV